MAFILRLLLIEELQLYRTLLALCHLVLGVLLGGASTACSPALLRLEAVPSERFVGLGILFLLLLKPFDSLSLLASSDTGVLTRTYLGDLLAGTLVPFRCLLRSFGYITLRLLRLSSGYLDVSV